MVRKEVFDPNYVPEEQKTTLDRWNFMLYNIRKSSEIQPGAHNFPRRLAMETARGFLTSDNPIKDEVRGLFRGLSTQEQEQGIKPVSSMTRKVYKMFLRIDILRSEDLCNWLGQDVVSWAAHLKNERPKEQRWG